jgi:hypothetical protein
VLTFAPLPPAAVRLRRQADIEMRTEGDGAIRGDFRTVCAAPGPQLVAVIAVALLSPDLHETLPKGDLAWDSLPSSTLPTSCRARSPEEFHVLTTKFGAHLARAGDDAK